MGQFSVELWRWEENDARRKPAMVLASSLGEPGISDSPVGSSGHIAGTLNLFILG